MNKKILPSVLMASAISLAFQAPASAQNYVGFGSVTDLDNGQMEESAHLRLDIPQSDFSVRGNVAFETEGSQVDVMLTYDNLAGFYVGPGISAIPDESPRFMGVLGYEFLAGSNITGAMVTTESDFMLYTGFFF